MVRNAQFSLADSNGFYVWCSDLLVDNNSSPLSKNEDQKPFIFLAEWYHELDVLEKTKVEKYISDWILNLIPSKRRDYVVLLGILSFLEISCAKGCFDAIERLLRTSLIEKTRTNIFAQTVRVLGIYPRGVVISNIYEEILLRETNKLGLISLAESISLNGDFEQFFRCTLKIARCDESDRGYRRISYLILSGLEGIAHVEIAKWFMRTWEHNKSDSKGRELLVKAYAYAYSLYLNVQDSVLIKISLVFLDAIETNGVLGSSSFNQAQELWEDSTLNDMFRTRLSTLIANNIEDENENIRDPYGIIAESYGSKVVYCTAGFKKVMAMEKLSQLNVDFYEGGYDIE